MKKFWKNCKGAVTVLVSLMLIPAILVSGTAVDLARYYTAKSIIQDANQLASNSVLASYQAMLQDLYGLFGVLDEQDDLELSSMVNGYIVSSIFGEENATAELGTLQLFYGSQVDESVLKAEQYLGDPDVLLRQIEEYAKYRAPVAIVEEVLERLEAFEKAKEDAKIIKDKMEVDDSIEDLEGIYKEIYDKIGTISEYPSLIASIENDIQDSFDDIYFNLFEMLIQRGSYDRAVDGNNEEAEENAYQRYEVLIDNTKTVVEGGTLYKWINGDYDENGEWQDGKREKDGYINDKESLEGKIDRYSDALESYKDELDELVTLCEKADKKKEEIQAKVDNINEEIDSGNCSEALATGLQETMEEYENLFKYDTAPMAEAMRGVDRKDIQNTQDFLDTLAYGSETNYLSLSNLKNLNACCPIDYNTNTIAKNSQKDDTLSRMASAEVTVSVPSAFEQFNSSRFNSTHNAEFYDQLKKLFGEGSSEKQKKDDTQDAIEDAMGDAQDKLIDALTFNPEGAKYYRSSVEAGEPQGFGTSGDWSEDGEAKDATEEALNGDLLDKFSELGTSMISKLLLVTYDSEMFSNYTTPSKENEQVKSMAGIPMSTDVNYFFQSELEFLYNGNEGSAVLNLMAVSGMMLLIRFVFNYVASFSVASVKTVVAGVKAAFSWAGPFAIVISELARLGMALGESVEDVIALKAGKKVPLYKNDSNWKFSLSGALKGVIENVISDDDDTDSSGTTDSSVEFSYVDYLRLFLLLENKDKLLERTKTLIELNVTNKKEGINADEGKMSSADVISLDEAITDFTLTTTVDLRYLFLSMGFAQQGIDGIVPPTHMEITVTDYRGY